MILLAKPRRESQHQLDPLDLVKPVGERSFHFTLLGWKDTGWTAWPEALQCEGTRSVERSVSCRGTPDVIFRVEPNDRHSAPPIDAQFFAELFGHLAFQEPKINLRRIGFRDPLEKGTLLDAVSAPDAAMNKDLDLALKAGDEPLLGRIELAML